MVKYCVVATCARRRRSGNVKNTENAKKPSLFKVPKDPEMLRMWSNALYQELSSNDYVCENHFNENDIVRKDVLTMPDGTIYSSDRIKTIPKSGAVPTLNKNESNNSEVVLLKKPNITTEGASIDKEEPVDLLFDPTNLRVNNMAQAVCTDTKTFSIMELIETLKVERLPQKWCWIAEYEDSPAIVLCYIDSKSYDIMFRVKINSNLKITVTSIKTKESAKSDFIISCLDDFWQFLMQMEISKFCSGTGFDSPRSSLTCTVILLNNEICKKQMEVYRCDSCRKLRKTLQNRLYKPMININERYETIKRQLHSEKKKCKRLINKNETLKQKMNEEKLKCAAVKDSTIEKAIFNLPPIQQETVQYCYIVLILILKMLQVKP